MPFNASGDTSLGRFIHPLRIKDPRQSCLGKRPVLATTLRALIRTAAFPVQVAATAAVLPVVAARTLAYKLRHPDSGERGPMPLSRWSNDQKRLLRKWSGSDRFVLTSQSDGIIKAGTNTLCTHRKIPRENVFGIALDDVIDEIEARKHAGAPDKVCHPNSAEQFLKKLSHASRLDLIGHGSADVYEGLTPKELATTLYEAGLRNVGVIKIQACDIGKEDYLDRLNAELIRLGVNIGYSCAPTGGMVDLRINMKIGRKMNLPLYFGPQKFGNGFAAESVSLKVVKGNMDIGFHGTRYNT